MQKTKIFKWTLSKEDVEKKLGRNITDSEFETFFQAFHDYFKLEYNSTFDWLSQEWENIKWDYV